MQTMFMKRAVWRAIGAAAMLLAGATQAAGVPGQGTWETTLQPRDLNGDGVADAFYDTTLDVTWLRDANVSGRIYLWTAKTWAADLDVYGVKGWRLPTMIDTMSTGCNFGYPGTDCGYNVQTKSGDPTKYEPDQTVYSEMAHLWYVALGNKGYYAPGTGVGPQPGWGLSNTGSFQNMQSGGYWSGLDYGAWRGFQWVFYFDNGGQGSNEWRILWYYVMAVHDGDVGVAPFPFSGFFSPVENPPTPNVMKAGAAVPVKFGLGGDRGLDVISAGYPQSRAVACPGAGTPGKDVVELTLTAGKSSLNYDVASDTYTYAWKTDKAWAGTCRQLTVRLSDTTRHTALFQFN